MFIFTHMAAILLKPTRNILSITLIALLIFIGGTFFLHTVPSNVKDKIADGLLGDFVITFPVLYYFIIIRPLKKSARSLLLVISLCCVAAYLALPQHQRGYILQVRKLTALAELSIIIYAFTKFKKIRASYKAHQLTSADPIYSLRAAMSDVLGDTLAIRMIASELAVLRYGLFFWKSEKSVTKSGATSFTTHKESGYIALWCIFLVAVLVEIVAFHFLLLKWSHTAAVIVTGISLYGTILFIADLSAILKRKVTINEDQLILRLGLRWKADTRLGNINSLQKITYDCKSTDLYFKGGVIKSSGNLLITFKEPVTVHKLYGESKEFSSILLNIDDFERFAEAINTAGSLHPLPQV